jgi:hypothetical protein
MVVWMPEAAGRVAETMCTERQVEVSLYVLDGRTVIAGELDEVILGAYAALLASRGE